ncbi:MAG: SIS domain-containing protein [Verrucomicrobia bacterium]|nr:SIS domain-containing protein [Verrucomicrobiota bacterium]
MNLAHDLSALEETVKRCHALVPAVESAGRAIAERIRSGSKLLACGNGGSAADAMHLAEEMTGRYRSNRKALPALALDILVIFSTSGKSPNILKALRVAKERKLLRIGALGKGGGPARELCDHAIVVPSEDTSRIQEIHGWIIHAWLECVEAIAVGKA